MTAFQSTSLLITAIWSILVIIRFRRSTVFMVGGLLALGLYTLIAFIYGKVVLAELGLNTPDSWLYTIGLALVGLAVMLAYSPVADKIASQFFEEPPTLDAFRGIQQSTGKLIGGIVIAWVLGGVLEELIVRGIVLMSVRALLATWINGPVAVSIAVLVAAAGAGFVHAYQGPRAMAIITQLSILFGILFILSGYNLWAVMFCHGLYDTIAFIRFANKKSKYSKLDQD